MATEFITRSSVITDHSSPARFIFSHIRRHPLYILGLTIGAFSNAALAAVIPAAAGTAFNAIINGNDLDTVAWMAVVIVASQTIRAVLQLIRNSSAEVFAQRIERDVRDELYANLLGKSMSFHDSQPVGEIMARVTNDVRELNLMMNPGVNLIVGSGMFLIMPVLFGPGVHPALILTPLLFVIAHVIAQYFFVRSLHPIAQKVRASFGHMNAHLAEAIDGLQVVKGTAQEEQEIVHFNRMTDEVSHWYIKQGDIEARYVPLLMLGLTFVGGFIHAAYLFYNGLINTGDVVTFIGLLYLFTFPVFTSLTAFSQVALGYASAKRILDIINEHTLLDENRGGYEGKMRGEITFENVAFGYLDGTEVMHDVSFTVRPGQTVAIVGQTGSGKTTITKLINRMYDVSTGRVLVDGIDVRDWNLAALRSQISVIEQDIFLFSRTIADNIQFGTPAATREQIEDAARKAQAHDFIQTFDDDYETVIGQRGVTLSGGQRQRLAIARAFMTNPPVLILDDSTSAIDSATEDHIQRAIWEAAKGRTTLLITHRLSQIRWADHIVVLRHGQVVAQGKHEDLLKTSDAYQRIFARYESPRQTKTTIEHATGD